MGSSEPSITCRVADAEPVERVETPPPEDQEFEDDDGTIYEWNHKRRKFQPKAVNDDGGYKMEDMTFEMDEETIPVLEMPEEVSSIYSLQLNLDCQAAERRNLGHSMVDLAILRCKSFCMSI